MRGRRNGPWPFEKMNKAAGGLLRWNPALPRLWTSNLFSHIEGPLDSGPRNSVLVSSSDRTPRHCECDAGFSLNFNDKSFIILSSLSFHGLLFAVTFWQAEQTTKEGARCKFQILECDEAILFPYFRTLFDKAVCELKLSQNLKLSKLVELY